MQAGTLDVTHIHQALRSRRIGRSLFHLVTTGSTNDEAWRFADQDEADGLVVLAEQQTQARGRLGRRWQSPRGASLLCSVLLIDSRRELDAAFISLASGVAVHEAVTQVTELMPSIKWPNDVLVSGRKLSGILVESRNRADGVAVYVVGVGVNCLQQSGHFPPELASRATSLEIQSLQPVDRNAVAIAVLRELDRRIAGPSADKEEQVRQEWLRRCDSLGQAIALVHDGRVYRGTVLDVDPSAALVVKLDEGGVRLFSAADTTVLVDEKEAGTPPGQ